MDPCEDNPTPALADPTAEDSMEEGTEQQEPLYTANTPLILDTAISIDNGSVMDTQNIIVSTTAVGGTEVSTTGAITIGSQMYIIQPDPTQAGEGSLEHQAFVLQPDGASSVSGVPTTQEEAIGMQSAAEGSVVVEGSDMMSRADYATESVEAEADTFQSMQAAEEEVAGVISPGRHVLALL